MCVCVCVCVRLRFGMYNTIKGNSNSFTVCPPAKASCSFSDGEQLCDYKQGCRDPGMANWTVVQGKT